MGRFPPEGRRHRRRQAVLAVALAVLGGCLAPPDLKSCAEFPLGTDGCPSACEIWCDAMLEACPGAIPNTASDVRRGCLNSCGEAQLPNGTFGESTGDSMACRIEHARRAASAPLDHCAAASLEGGGVCSDLRCDVYCDLMVAHCPETYVDRTGCLEACAPFPTEARVPPSTNTLACRVEQARAAAANPAACAGAAPSGGGLCGTPCEAYCDQLDAHCDAFPIYPDRAACESTCALLLTDADVDASATERNTVECRLYHASYPAASDPGTHCEHAGVYHASHCGPVCDTYCELMARHCPGTYPDADGGPTDACHPDCLAIEMAEQGDAVGERLWPNPAATIECLPAP